ncbi:imidazolonepropionase [Schumannella luteola]|uniref:Imidazolonepropionase n=1 Tax=Schumannella luteola TaxID=472059 RepID=A0A852YR71_9MICO|nr:imidazolonepropionase [Schumannella luteola]NYH00200.1 imidazolonepropionase [Schumannella luteola]TPX04049.1 imidazolonepropionase [Schumannella luteola]
MTSPGTLLVTNIGELTTNDDEHRDGARIADAAVVIEGDRFVWVGEASAAPSVDQRLDAGGRAALPGWVDAHTHLVYAGDRSAEFEARMAGQAYAAGGINVTVAATRAADEAELERLLVQRVSEAQASGTTALETKTGYGLTVADEERAARLAARYADEVTFLGAHVVPPEAEAEGAAGRAAYLDLVTGPMLDAVAPHVSAVDVFCEKGAFSEQESARVLRAAAERGLATHVHGNQLGYGPGVRLAVEHGSLSVDHVGFLDDGDVDALAGTWHDPARERGTVATVLPACDLSTRMPLAPARRLLDAGVPIAIASNANPGTSNTSSMAFCVATAVLQMRLTVAEAVRAATLGGAIALDRHRAHPAVGDRPERPRLGVVAVGARADLHLLDAPSASHLAYRPGMPLTHAVWRAGRRVV